MGLHQFSLVFLKLLNVLILNEPNFAHKLSKLSQRLVSHLAEGMEGNKKTAFIVNLFSTTLAILLRTCQGNSAFRVDADLCDGVILLAGELWLFEGEAVED